MGIQYEKYHGGGLNGNDVDKLIRYQYFSLPKKQKKSKI
jgi:hypothetical protein